MKNHYVCDDGEHIRIYGGGSDPVVVIDMLNCEILYLNQAAQINLSDKAFKQGMKCHEYFHDKNMICDFCAIKNTEKIPKTREIYVEGVDKYFLAQIEKIDWNGRDAIIQHFNDITLEKQYEKIKNNLSIAIKHSGMNYIEWDMVNDIAYLKLVPTDFLYKDKVIENFTWVLKKSGYLLKEDIDRYEKQLYSLIKGEIGELIIESRRITHNKKYEWRRYYITVNEWDDEKKPKNAIISSIAINDIKKLEKGFSVVLKQNGITSWTYNPNTGEISDVQNPIFGIINDKVKNVEELYDDYKLVHPQDVDELKKLYKKVGSGEQNANCIIRLKVGDSYKWININYTSILDRDGSVLYSIGSSFDMTEEMELKLQYDEAIKLFRESSDSNDLAIIIDITEGEIISYNGKSKITDFSTKSYDEYLEGLKQLALRKSDIEWFESIGQKNIIVLYNQGERIIERELNLKAVTGIKWYRDRLKMIKNPDNGHLILFITTVDITNEKKLDVLINNVANTEFEMLITVNLNDETFIMYSKGGKNYSGHDFFQRAKKNIDDIDYDKNNLLLYKITDKDKILELLNGDKYVDYVSVNVDGIKYHKKININYTDELKDTVCIYVTDVSDIYNNEQKKNAELRIAKEEAEKANAVKTDFLGKMSHDMRTPLNAIMSLSDFGLEEARDFNIKDYFGKIKSSSELLLGLLNDLLDLSGIEKDKIELNPRPVKVSEHVESILEIVKPKAVAKNIDISFEYDSLESSEYEIFDPIRTAQIFVNIIGNAIKYTPPGGSILWHVKDELKEDGRLHHYHVISDNGIGMEEDFLKDLFKPFTRENRGIGELEAGTGLGMSIVKNIVEAMGGRVDCTSEKNKGTKFIVEFDCGVTTKSEYEQYMNSSDKIYQSNLMNKRVLLCEDVEINAQIVKRILNKIGMDVDIAENGLVGLSMLKEREYDIVLMDIRMPVMDGITAAKNIRSFNKRIPIVALSANAYEADINSSQESGMNAHLSKPIKKNELIRTIAKLIK